MGYLGVMQVGVSVQIADEEVEFKPSRITLDDASLSNYSMTQISSVPQTTLGFLLPNGYYGGACHSLTPDRAGSLM